MLNFILKRLKESTTWKGLVYILAAAGVTLEPDQVQAIIAAGLAIVGAIEVFTKEKK